MRAYLTTFDQLGIDTWLAHGSLLGWWWGKKVSFLTIDVFAKCYIADVN